MDEKDQISGKILEAISSQLAALGIDLNAMCSAGAGEIKVKAICVVPDLGDSVKEMADSPRDQVVMVRVDQQSAAALDCWVESGSVKSRSEAAALFIREGLKVHSRELSELEDALREVDNAKRKLRDKARHVIGSEGEGNE